MMRIHSLKFLFSNHSKICIIGGGTGGISVSSHLLRSNVSPLDIRIFQPAKKHYYQPAWTMVGSNLCSAESTEANMTDIIPSDIAWTKSKVTKVDPNTKTIDTENGEKYTYDHIIFSSGIQLNWGKIKGAKELLEDKNSKVCSIYDYNYSQKTGRLGKELKGGKAIFTEPAPPIKCAGAPQKILYLWTDKWQKKKISVDVEYIKFGGAMFGVPKYSQSLVGIAKSYGIKTTFNHNLVEVNERHAIFQNNVTKEKVQKNYDFLHIVPPMSAHQYISDSGLADAQGYLDLHKHTLRHNKYPSVWGIGDCTSLPNSKTAAAIFTQTQTLIKNLTAVLKDPSLEKLPSSYEGYASCPLFVGKGKLMLAEFKYGGEIDETFYKDQEKPRRQFYFLKRYFFPAVYWNLMPRGLWGGRKGIRFI